ncbi:MAG TPA: type III-A CRISPR-associated protein Csm2 [Chloroflexus aurantiacus]|uniref:CRISPR system Cms protein Csm2 n=2 Tax=Chloroflexaceae TaxID=1106 RepID=A9WEP9_CHLAA|nr:CRISPR-associated protein, Csm2 family [Chloroflexus aurantiacus J-10-fl]RMG46648.1 MAG: type III-A CRISPR-associated protein Csm2 [Chloroflexota bacterium]GIV64499.1 MAG: type III-A CRISPR-associated protein Csm2 [Bellilinea sp.]GIV95127.1 MAG: type III-A CRISPR-associated protein Csm2 [Chloroflexus sp.]HBW69343.1 type III-A CRISPR-associated protein Csm2 [Chloroflexus aurantiacus]
MTMGRSSNPQAVGVKRISSENLQRIMTESSEEAMKLLVQEADRLGKELGRNGLTTSQIRNIFGEVRSIEQEVLPTDQQLSLDVQRRLLMLKPKMAYQVGRFSNNQALQELVETLSDAIGLIGNDKNRFQTFVNLFEAILAYHRRYGGKTN